MNHRVPLVGSTMQTAAGPGGSAGGRRQTHGRLGGVGVKKRPRSPLPAFELTNVYGGVDVACAGENESTVLIK